ncbi:KAT8 regulatory NSL complex subunit 1 isoform X2 [Amia ocellicauda]|uniref:KAT8 regulatory NSL complex subunit 1 isoform X2 n=1 Tax=Amia ocellicauda TaxID=2972642 RepID=UPI00346432D2
MAAMAPALTDAPAEAHHIRFKLAPPSSTLSPGSVENNSNASNIILSSNGAVKRKPIVSSGEERALDFRGSSKKEEQQQHQESSPPTPLGKLQPLVASYLCSDVTSVPSTKESLKLQGVLIKQTVLKSHAILPNTYFNSRKHQTLEFSGDQIKSIMSVSSTPVSQPQAPVNGLAKKLGKSTAGSERDCPAALAAVNGNKPPAIQDSHLHTVPGANSALIRGDLTGSVLLKGGGSDQQQQQPPPAGILKDAANNSEPPPPSSTNAAPAAGAAVSQLDLTSEQTDADDGEEESSSSSVRLGLISLDSEGAGCSGSNRQAKSAHSPIAPQPQQFSSLDAEVRARSLVNQNRQNEIENRLRRLRKRLQVVQAKQVERHVQQQLGSFLQTTFSKLPSLDSLRQRSPAVLTRKAEAALRRAASETGGDDGLSQFLKSGSVPTELERLSLSGTANLRATESAFDSDVTESSSGGETDIEEEELTKVDIEQRHISLWRRAEGRYAMERASIVSHWNWLQAHISDLEYRIRQQTDIYRQIRVNKGSVVLGDSAPCDVSAEDGVAVKSEPCDRRQITPDCHSLEAVDSMASPHSPAADGLSWKGCGSARPVNGVISSLHHGQPDSGSPDDSDTEELLNKKQRLTPLSSPPDNTCVAARTRPILSCKKRRLVRPSTVATLNRKVHRSSGARCSCDVNPLCVICGGRAQPCCDFQYESPLLERLSQFDPCVHPILSFSDDVSMNLHFQRVMKSHWQNKPLEKVKPLKKLSLKHKISLSGRLPDSTSKDKHKLTNSLLAAARHSHHKVRPEKIHRQQIDDLLSASKLERTPVCKQERTPVLTPTSYDKSHSRKRQRDHSTERAEPTPKLYMDTGSPCSSSLANLHTPAHSPLMRQLSTSSESSTPFALNSQSASGTPQPVRRRRGESSFDINNIVIPMSVAATTRVEKLQYKEILTPSWREVDICAQPIAEEDDVMEIEDLSDAAFAQLHLKCEDLERSRWTWTASAPAKRRGSRSYKSSDGRTTPLLGGTNPSTPQPASPDGGHFQSLQDYGHMPSPHSPASPDVLSNPHTPGSRDSHRPQPGDDTRCSTPDFTFEELLVQPWERRNFPLPCAPEPEPEPEDLGEAAERMMRGIRRISGSKSSSRSESENGPASPLSEDGKARPPPVALRPAHR